jgi:hypothetical protein
LFDSFVSLATITVTLLQILNSLMAHANVAIISVGERTEGYKALMKSATHKDLEHMKVIKCDVRPFLPRNPSKFDSSNKHLDGSHAVTQRSVMLQPDFAKLMKNLIDEAMEKSHLFANIIMFLICTGGGHRAWVCANTLAEALNAIGTLRCVDTSWRSLRSVDTSWRSFNARHFPMGWLNGTAQIESAWDSASAWAQDPWELSAQTAEGINHKYGYEAAGQRMEAFNSLSEVWDYVSAINGAETEAALETETEAALETETALAAQPVTPECVDGPDEEVPM